MYNVFDSDDWNDGDDDDDDSNVGDGDDNDKLKNWRSKKWNGNIKEGEINRWWNGHFQHLAETEQTSSSNNVIDQNWSTAIFDSPLICRLLHQLFVC